MEFNIYKTTDYSKFKLIDSNREINKTHINRLKKSFKEMYLTCPILVNENFEVIDGQNRLTAAKEMGLPILYFVVPGYGASQMKRLNVTKSKWSLSTYFKGYLNENRVEYLKLKHFMDKYNLKLNLATILINGHDSHTTTKEIFKNGNFVFKNEERSNELAEMFQDLNPYIKKTNRDKFIRAFLSVSRQDSYKHSVMINKLEKSRLTLGKMPRTNDYIIKIEEIYNHKNKKERVHFSLV